MVKFHSKARLSAAFLFLVLLTLAPLGPVLAQDASAPPAPATLSAEEARKALKLLEDDAARGRAVEQLRLLAKSADAAGEAERVTIGARVVSTIRERMTALGDVRDGVIEAARLWPSVVGWVEKQLENKTSRERWTSFITDLSLVLASGLAAWAVLTWLLSHARRRLDQRTPKTTLGKLPPLIARTILGAIPIAALGVTAYAVLAGTEPTLRVRLAALPIINATIAIQLLTLAGAFLLSPRGPGLRLIPIGDQAAKRAQRQLRLLGLIGFYGWFLAEALFVLGLPAQAYFLMLKMVGAAVAGMLIYRIWRHRHGVAALIRGGALVDGDEEDGRDHHAETVEAITGDRRLGLLRRRAADVWHVIASAYVAVICGLWLLEIKGGFTFLAKATSLTVVVFWFAAVINGALARGLARPVTLSPRLARELPSLPKRVDDYRPWARLLLGGVIWLLAAVLVLDAWGLGVTNWLMTASGQRALGGAITISLALVLAVVAWTVVSLVIEHALLPEGAGHRRVEKSARVRTLLPLLRNAFLVLLVIFVGLFTLAEMGVNIAPLLAGAGVVGLAIGFGSQTLVKDVITGLFILIEDTIAVGDVVTVGSHSGVVEAISIRTIRLRDVAGSVHTVPFSAVTTITNMTKDFSFAVFEVGVAYREDTDNVCEVLREIAADLENDDELGRDILEPLEIMGVDRFGPSEVVIKARFKTKPIRQWAVGREFNRRMKMRFDELGISIPFPHRQLMWDPPPELLKALTQPKAVEAPKAADVPKAVETKAGND